MGLAVTIQQILENGVAPPQVFFSTTALDYTAPNTSATGTITINAGGPSTASSQKTYFTIPLNVDGIDENTEYLDINLETVTNAAKRR